MAMTPMMKQYFEIKEKHEDCILFFRLGDFYEMFFEDALKASKELELTLTGRDCGLEERAPMCGVPYHSSENYINKLIQKGYKVAICEQVEDPKDAKGIVKRDVIRIITPGTIMSSSLLEEKKNNYIMSLYIEDHVYGIAFMDVTTGDFHTCELKGENIKTQLIDEIAKFNPTEIINNISGKDPIIQEIEKKFNTIIYSYYSWTYEYENAKKKLMDQFQVLSLDGLGLQSMEHATSASGSLLYYVEETQKINLHHISELKIYHYHTYMSLDISSRRNLELTETLREKSKKGSLLWILDKTQTAMGGRLLRQWIEQPLISSIEINKRLFAVLELKNDLLLKEDLKEDLNKIYDLERLIGKIVYGTVNGRDLICLKNSLKVLPFLKEKLKNCTSLYLKEILENIDDLQDCYALIENAIIEEPPISVKEGNIIKTGYNREVDNLRSATTDGKTWIADLERKEKEKTKIKSLKIGFNKVFGYYIEVTKSYYDLVPEEYIRKQTLSNAERYITPELKEIENVILGAEDKVTDLEYKLFLEIRKEVELQIKRIQSTAKQIAQLDVLQSFAEVAEKQNYVCPTVNEEEKITIKEGRHPVVEKMISQDSFITNDTYLDNKEDQFMIITGPNMAGKSTYMRQVALIVLMAQIGSFVPASSATIGIVDRIFTRVGASDDLASGQSTFMVEMSEVSNILNNSTSKSLLILDEIGRGTSTFDGLSIAWAVVEHISDTQKIGAKTLFATHYHELTELEGRIQGVKNYSISVKEQGDNIIFLRKIIRGGADHSYGIQVAKLAGIPQSVIQRAKEILLQLEDHDIAKNPQCIGRESQSLIKENNTIVKESIPASKESFNQLNLFELKNQQQGNEIILQLQQLDFLKMTPMEAMNVLYELHNKSKK